MTLPIDEARKNDEIISLADSMILRWIDEINGMSDADSKAKDIKQKIKLLRKEENSVQNKRTVKKLYSELDALQFKPDYMFLVIDKKKDYYRACEGFYINDIKYQRLLGTNGGIKNSTIVFVNEKIHNELQRRIDNGRDITKPLVTAKLEAYQALTCSASTPVSTPDGVLIVDDAETEFLSDIVYLTDENDGEPEMTYIKDYKVNMDASDGFGLMLPSLAEKWSSEIGIDYVTSGVNTRFSFEKGMVFTFDFRDFAENVAGTYIVKDAWGNEVDVRNVELILTTSMVKLWSSYKSCDHYVQTSLSNGYTFGIAKCCPKELESQRTLNYQFIQSYDLTDEDIEELIEPTVTEIKDVISGDWRKTVLFLKGAGLNEKNIDRLENDYAKAIMIDHELINDPFIQNSVYQLIKNRINEAKVGVLNVHGNYSIVSGDPYLLCQSIFGLEKTGLLKAGEIYNGYWDKNGAEKLSCYRAPMTCHANIRLVCPVRSDDARYWYRYMKTCTILNSWDTATAALNGCDFDGDLVFLTDNNVLVKKLQVLPSLMCIQRKAQGKVSTTEDFIKSNIESFGNDIGQTTNWITSMFEVQSHFDKDSDEYKELAYRIQCGQLYQQNAIDKAKGIIAKPMPLSWHDRHAANKIDDDHERTFYRSIVADKKPYFMKYIYPALMKQYNTYINNTNRNALREFQLTVDEIKALDDCNRTDRMNEFLRYFEYRMPVGTGPCVMNRICKRFEEEFDGYISKHPSVPFDYTILKSDEDYSHRQYSAIKKLYLEYNHKLANYSVFADYERIDECEAAQTLAEMNEEFKRLCNEVCTNDDVLCNIIIDIVYSKSNTKRFAWNMCADQIIHNLLEKNDYKISYPCICQDEDADITFNGNSFIINTHRVEEVE